VGGVRRLLSCLTVTVSACCSVLQCVAVRCSVLQCVASVLQCVAACRVAVCCSFMRMSYERVGTLTNVTKGVQRLLCCFTLPVAACCSVLKCVAVCCKYVA